MPSLSLEREAFFRAKALEAPRGGTKVNFISLSTFKGRMQEYIG